VSVTSELMTMEHWWDDTARGRLNSLERGLCQCQFAQHKFHTCCLGLNPDYHGRKLAAKNWAMAQSTQCAR